MWNDFRTVFIENDRWRLYLEGLGNTLLITVFGSLLGFALGMLLALALYRCKNSAALAGVAFIIRQYINVFRAIPLVVLLLVGYFSVFIFVPSAIVVAILVIGISTSAYFAEIIRGGIDSVDTGQIDAARSLGFSYSQTMRKIILPQGLKNCLPSIGNELTMILKLTSLVGWIAIVDMTQAANIISSNTFIYFMPLCFVAVVYIVLVSIMSLVFKFIEKRLGRYSSMVKISNLSKSYKDLIVLKDFELEVAKGDRLCVIGGSGSGKTTLLRIIAGLAKFDTGDITFENNVTLKDIGFVFQNYNLFTNKTVLQNITLPLVMVRKIDKETAVQTARALLEKLNLADKENAYPNHLSGGQKQRVAIARALAIQPKILLVDEPAAALDPQNVNNLVDIINNKIDKDITIIIVTHSIEFVKRVAKTVAFIHNGKIEEIGCAKAILKTPKSNALKGFLVC